MGRWNRVVVLMSRSLKQTFFLLFVCQANFMRKYRMSLLFTEKDTEINDEIQLLIEIIYLGFLKP